MKLYNEIPDMECLSGDTLDFEVDVDGLSELTSPSMRCTISKRGVENSVLGFFVQLLFLQLQL